MEWEWAWAWTWIMIAVVVWIITTIINGISLVWIASKAVATATSIEKIHVAVNSERTAMLDEIRLLRGEVLSFAIARAKREQKDVDENLQKEKPD